MGSVQFDFDHVLAFTGLWGCIELLFTLLLRHVQVLIKSLNDRVLYHNLLLELLLSNLLSDALQAANLSQGS